MSVADYFIHHRGNKKRGIVLYALSTCVWCKKTKALLDELDADYDYIDVDLLDEGAQGEVVEELTRWNPNRTFPTLVIKNDRCIVGFKEGEIRGLFADG